MSKKKEAARRQQPASILLLLKEAQSQFGYVPETAIAEIAESLHVSVSDVYGVATFYSFLATKLPGKNIIRVCQSLPCHMKDSTTVIDSLFNILGIKPGETTPDRRFSMQLTNCIGACDEAPAMLINNDLHTNLTADKIAKILEGYK
ncbi:MAG: NADH-quinone oxidoreductase subunit NuoE [Chloroflexota bacterium]